MSIAHVGGHSVNSKPCGRDSQLLLWISYPFWFTDPDFKHNLRVTHSTFLRIVELVSASVLDSVHPLTGTVRQTKEFKVAVALYHLGHGGTWRTTANTCGIGLSTAKGYVKLVAAAVISHGKPLYAGQDQLRSLVAGEEEVQGAAQPGRCCNDH